MQMTQNHARLLRTWAAGDTDKRVGGDTFLMEDFYEQTGVSLDWAERLAADLHNWELARARRSGFGGPYGDVTEKGRQWLADNPNKGRITSQSS